jgi:hypothetical protein
MQITSIELFEPLKPKLGEKEAKSLVMFVEEKAEERIAQKKDVFLTKDDKVDLIKWMVGFWIAQMAAIIGLYIRG